MKLELKTNPQHKKLQVLSISSDMIHKLGPICNLIYSSRGLECRRWKQSLKTYTFTHRDIKYVTGHTVLDLLFCVWENNSDKGETCDELSLFVFVYYSFNHIKPFTALQGASRTLFDSHITYIIDIYTYYS